MSISWAPARTGRAPFLATGRPARVTVGQPPRAPRRTKHLFSPWRRRWNAVKTALLLAFLGGALVAVGSLFGRLGALVGLVLGVAAVAGSFWFSDRLALRAAGAVPVAEWELPVYRALVRELCAEARLPMPRLYVIPAAQPNAFATGRSPRHAAVAVTTGLLDALTPRELKGVLAHELAHVGNRDVLLSSIAAALATGIGFLANMAGWIPFFGHSEDDEPSPLAAFVAALVAPVAALLLQLALSRSREFEADRTGAELLGDGRPLASALAKIERAAQRVPLPVEPSQASAYLVNPLTSDESLLTTRFRTHPATSSRIARLTRPGRSVYGS
ncbi:MAG: M48 family metalloprotease [Actinomycetota bacterium]|nr:M48 family metalloprotease [Actinomycetota bacterium]